MASFSMANSVTCSQVNLLSSIQHQQSELKHLAALLKSEEDREQYTKVIELSKIAQVRLDRLLEKRKSSHFDVRVPKQVDANCSNGSYILSKSHKSQYFQDHRNSRQSDCSDATLVSLLNGSSGSNSSLSTQLTDSVDDRCGGKKTEKRREVHLFRNDTYYGHPYRIIDRATSIRFQSDTPLLGRRASTDTIIVELDKDACNNSIAKKEQKIYVKAHRKATIDRRKIQQAKRISIIAAINSTPSEADNDMDHSSSSSSDDEEEEIEYPATVHIGIRKDASLITIGKLSSINRNINIYEPTNRNKDTKSIKSTFASTVNTIKNEPDPLNDAGMLTPPPDSPNTNQNYSVEKSDIEAEWTFDGESPPITRLQKKNSQSLKALFKRPHQLNHYTMGKGNSTLLSSKHPYNLHGITDSIDGRQKIMLKVIIVSISESTSERQRRFGLTFSWKQTGQQQQQQQQHQKPQNAAKFSVAPDSLVKEALTTWMESQIEQLKGDNIVMPALSKADEILRNGCKLYVVYDAALFPNIET